MQATITTAIKFRQLYQSLVWLALGAAMGVSALAVARTVAVTNPSSIYAIDPVSSQLMTGMVSYEVIELGNEPLFLREDEYLDLEAEGLLQNEQPYDNGLRSGAWRQSYPDLYLKEITRHS